MRERDRENLARFAGRGTIALLLVAVAAAGCSKETTTVERVDQLVNDGWKLFQNENYSDALDTFDEALTELLDYPPALHGRGWCLAYLGEYAEARLTFGTAKEYDPSNPDIWAGGTFVFAALADYDETVYWGETALGAQYELSGNFTWSFSQRTEITHVHLRLVLARAYWSRGSLTQCRDQLAVIEPDTEHGETAQALLDDLTRLFAIYAAPF